MKKTSIWAIFIALAIGGQSFSPILAADPDEPVQVSETEFSAGSTSYEESSVMDSKFTDDDPDDSFIESELQESDGFVQPFDSSDDSSSDDDENSSDKQTETKQISSEATSQTDASKQKTALQGARIEKADQMNADADYLILRVGSSKNTQIDTTLLQSAMKPDRPVVLEYDWSDQKVNAEMEAYRFFLLTRTIDQPFIPLLCVDSITESAGPKYIRELLDSWLGLTQIKPLITLGTQAKSRGDWRCLDGVYSVWENPAAFEGTMEDLRNLATPISTSKEVESLDRLYNPNSGEHFYTADRKERDHLVKIGWRYEGTGWNNPKSGRNVYRLYNPNAGDHHYTLDENERNGLLRLGWKNEGIAWKSSTDKTYPVYRGYNPNAKAGAHHFTLRKAEIEYLAKAGWKHEGIAWYSQAPLVPEYSFPSGNYRIGDKAYNVSGVQISGIQKIGSETFYFNPEKDGALETERGLRILPDGSRILIEDCGVLAAGVRKVGVSVYLFDPQSFKARVNVWNLMDGAYDQGRISFMYFDSQGIGQIKQPPRDIEEAFLVRAAGLSSLSDPVTGIRIAFKDYIRAHYGNDRINSFLDEALKYEGWPYVWAGKSPNTGFDCSGLVSWTMRKQWHYNVNPGLTNAQMLYRAYCHPISKAEAVPGDLVFWKWTYGLSREQITHVAVYVGNGWTYQAGDPIGFYPDNHSTNMEGQPAQCLYGRLR